MRLFGRTQPESSARWAWTLRAAAEVAERLAHEGHVILRQGARVRAGIGDHLVLFVERLGDLHGALGREAETAVRLALERGQVVKARRDLRAGLLFLGNAGDGLARAGGDDGLGLLLHPDAVDAVVLVVARVIVRTRVGAMS